MLELAQITILTYLRQLFGSYGADKDLLLHLVQKKCEIDF